MNEPWELTDEDYKRILARHFVSGTGKGATERHDEAVANAAVKKVVEYRQWLVDQGLIRTHMDELNLWAALKQEVGE
jgi:hypothetical protein